MPGMVLLRAVFKIGEGKRGSWVDADMAGLQAYNVLGNVMSLVGGICSMCCSLLLPSSFFLLLYWRSVHPMTRAAVCSLLAGSVALAVLITADNIIDIRHKLAHHSSLVSGTICASGQMLKHC